MLITNAELNARINGILVAWETHQDEFQDWIGGVVDGGAGSDGKYPLTDRSSNIRLTLSPAQLEDNVTGAVSDAETAQVAAELAETNAAASAATATTQAGLAVTARVAAQTAQTAAEAAQSAAETAESNAAADAVLTALDVISTAADVVSTNADVVLTNADVVITNADVVLTNADVVLTGLDVGYAAEWAKAVEDLLISAAAGGNQSSDYSALHWAAKAAATAAGIGNFDSLSDVTITTPATRHVPVHNGSGTWVNRLLVEADISDLQAYLTSETSHADVLVDADIGGSVMGYDATMLVDADIGGSVMAYDATMLVDADIGGSVMGYDATMLVDADIGGSVQAYDANTAKTDVAEIITAGWEIQSTSAVLGWWDSDAAADEKRWAFRTSAGQFRLQVRNDAGTTISNAMVFDRTGTNRDSATITSDLITLDGLLTVTGRPLFTGDRIEIQGSGWEADPTGIMIGLYNSTTGYIQIPGGTGQLDIWDGGTSVIATFADTNKQVTFYGPVDITGQLDLLGTDLATGQTYGGWRSTHATLGAMQVQRSDGGILGWVYGTTGYFGLLNAAGSWRLQISDAVGGPLRRDSSYNIYDAGTHDDMGDILDVTGSYGTIQVNATNGASGTWRGYSIGGRLVFMDNAGSAAANRGGLYDDANNRWVWQYNTAALDELTLYASGTAVAWTTSLGIRRSGKGQYVHHSATGNTSGVITVSTSSASGGANGDMWFKY